jgi:putative transposase
MESVFREIGYSRQGLLQYQTKQEFNEHLKSDIVELVTNLRVGHPRMGSRVIYYTLRNKGVELGIGVTKFEQMVSQLKLTVPRVKTSYPKTSDGKGKKDYPNLLNGLIVNDISKVFVGDITYYKVDGKWHYIFTLKDIYSQRFLGLYPAKSLEAINAVHCLKQAIKQRGSSCLEGCIHHTDNGSQYEANIYMKKLEKLKMIVSRAENCLENGSAEQLNNIIKNMYLIPWGITTFSGLQAACKKIMRLNNVERSIKQLGGLSPQMFEESLKSIPLDQRRTKELYDFANYKTK